MKKVFQTVIDKGKGNCAQAAIASLLELELEDVPNFIDNPTNEIGKTVFGYLHSIGFRPTYIERKEYEKVDLLREVAKFDGGMNGYFYASVPSQTFEGISHAVIVDTELKVVHDPNPNQKALDLTPNDINYIITMHDMVIGENGKLFTMEEWDKASKEEKDLNTHK